MIYYIVVVSVWTFSTLIFLMIESHKNLERIDANEREIEKLKAAIEALRRI